MTSNENLLYGIDLKTSDTGDLLISSSGDLAIIGGLDNLRASIRRMLSTDTGTWFEDKDYGCSLNRYLSRSNSESTRKACALEVKMSVSLEPRIKQIPIIKTIKFDDTRFDVEVTITPIGIDNNFNFIYPIKIGGL